MKINITGLMLISLLLFSCAPYHPSLFPSYNVLNPGPEVRINPIGFISFNEAGEPDITFSADIIPGVNYAIINEAFSQWVRELKDEVERLRELEKK